jgi:hypothetical protein
MAVANRYNVEMGSASGMSGKMNMLGLEGTR